MKLLVVGEDGSYIRSAVVIAKQSGAEVFLINSSKEALEYLKNGQCVSHVLFDVNLDIESFMNSLRNEKISSIVIAYGTSRDAKDAVAAIKAGAKDFIPLPPDEKVIAQIFTSLASKNIKPFIYKSPAIAEILRIIDRVSKSDAHILITGESGTGKEVLASYIHHNSNRAEKPFIRVNCAAIPENLLESELFGYEKGAFTGALSRRIGKFEESSGGTLLLDEISEMESRLQAKLLRAIQEREIDRIGGDKPIKVDLRIVATSNRDMLSEIKKGKFREDLYFRLNVISIEVPSLRDRKEDIEVLTKFFIEKYCKSNRLEEKKLSKQGLKYLMNHNWPGNVRELENVIHRAVLLSDGNEIMQESLKIVNYNRELYVKDDYLDRNQISDILGLSIDSLKERLDILAKDRLKR